MSSLRNVLSTSLALGLAAAAHANLILNGDFSAGLTDWTVTSAAQGSDQGLNIDSGTYNGVQPAANIFSYGDVANPSDFPASYDELDQVIPTISGDTYTISYAYAAHGDSYFYSFFGGQNLQSTSASGEIPWGTLSFTGVATGSSMDVEFFGNNQPSWNSITDVSVVQGAAAAPDTATTFALLALGLGAIVIGRRQLVRA